jgi:3-oxoacyl-[acyl-carrier-protein] synthase II
MSSSGPRPSPLGPGPYSYDDRIVVTGVGLWTPLARGREASWAALVEGRRAGRWLTEADEIFPAWVDATAFGQVAGAPAAERPLTSVSTVMALSVAREALDQAGLAVESMEPHRIGCVFGTSKGSFESVCPESLSGIRGSTGASPSPEDQRHWCEVAPDRPLAAILREHRWRGPASCPVAACATGALAVLQGAQWIREGRCDVVLAGSTDAALQPALMASYRRMGVLARCGDDPASAGRPFDRDRSGFLVGEGAGALVLERWSHARARGATPLAEWCGGVVLSDVAGMVRLDRSGETVAEAIRRTLKLSDATADEVDAISLHGTGTLENDVGESRGCRAALGEAALRASGFSVKGAIGHLLGAAGSVETAAAVLALRDQVVPPTANLRHPDPDCPLVLSGEAVRKPLGTVLKLSMGFGGHVVGMLLRRWDRS